MTRPPAATPDPAADRATTSGAVPLGRRLLLALGGAALIGGCASQPGTYWHTAPQANTLPGDSHPDTGTTASPEPSPSVPPSANPPTPGVCPRVPGIAEKPGGPQFYLPCHGTDIALTIDDGPDPTYTPQILALLAQYHIPATFCMIGRRAAAHPDLVARVAAAGHHIANHTLTHPLNLPTLTPAQIHDEIIRTSDTLTHLSGGTRPALFRSPGGNWSPTVIATCTAAGMRPLDWSVDPRDWSRPGVAHIVQVILTRTHPGSIVLEHDGGGNRQQTIDALRIALPRLIDAGYHFTQP